MPDDAITQTKRMAETHGCEFRDCGGGHVQIRANGVCVNYYPASKRRTAYCAETGERHTNCTPYNAVAMAMHGKKASGSEPPKPKYHKRPSKNGPDPDDIKPVTTNPAGLRHFYEGDVPPWDESLGAFQFETDSDRMRYRAWEKESEAIAMRAKADMLDEREVA